MPTAFAEATEVFARLLGDLGPSPDFSVAVEQRWTQLKELLAPYDAVALLGQFIASESLRRAETYRESETGGLAFVVEIVAAVLSTRAGRAGAGSPEAPIDANVLTPARELAREIALAEGLRRMQVAGELSAARGPLEAARGRVALWHLLVRGPGWPWQEEELLADLFGNYADELVAAVGFDAAQAVALSRATHSLMERRMLQGPREAADQLTEAVAWAEAELVLRPGALDDPVAPRILAALRALVLLGENALMSPGELSAEADVPLDEATAYLDLFSTQFGQEGEPFALVDKLRAAPFIKTENRYLLTVPGADLWALRRAFESRVKGQKYSRHRGRWFERRVRQRVEGALAPDRIFSGVEIFEGDTKIGEVDVLLLFDDVAVLFEAKSGTQRDGARRGGEALIGHLRETLTKSAAQAEVAAEVLLGERDAELRSGDGSRLDLPSVRKIHPILVTLDELSMVAPVVWQLSGTKVLPDGSPIPWVISWHDLELVLMLVASPAQFVHFLERRARLNQLGGRFATDELDWWMLYLRTRLYFEDDDVRADVAKSYWSQTDELDAWVLSKRGLRSPAPMPEDVLDPKIADVVNALVADRPRGWMAAACAFLSVSDEAAKRFWRELAEGRGRVARGGRVQRGTNVLSDGPSRTLLCWVVVPEGGASEISHELVELVEARLAEHPVDLAVAVGLVENSPRPYDELLVVSARGQ